MSKDAADELDNLSNVDLRARCVQYGLPNVPITDTSRKLLIRRLRVAMDGGGDANAKPAAKGKSRRETINVVAKVVEPAVDTSPKKGRTVTSRRTIGSAEPAPPTKEPSVELSVSSIPQRRRSGRMTPVPTVEPVITATVKRKATIIDEESDEEDDDNDVQIVDYDRPQIARSSRSPSLAKSKTVTTSYQHIKAQEPIHEEPSYVPRETVIPVRLESSYQLSKPTIVTTHYERESSSYLPRPTTGQLSRPSLTPSSNYTTQHATSSQSTRRYTTSGGYNKAPIDYTPSVNLGYRTQVNEYLNSSENSEDNADEDDENLDAPYLSDFARRLSRLKAEPMIDSSGPGSLRKDSSQLRESQRYYTTSIGGRRSISKHGSLVD